MTGSSLSLRTKVLDALLVLSIAALYATLVGTLLSSFPTMDFTGVFHPWIGISLGILLRNRRRYILGVFLGTIIVPVITTKSWVAGVPIGVGATLASYCGAWLIASDKNFDSHLNSLRDYLRVLLVGASVCAIPSTIFRALLLFSIGELQIDNFGAYSLQWWMGDALGIALVSPLILVFRKNQFHVAEPKCMTESALLLGLCFLAGQIIFIDWFSGSFGKIITGYWMFLLVALVAVRLGKAGTAFVLIMVAVQAFTGAYLSTGIFTADVFSKIMMDCWLYLMILSVVGMALATYVAELQISNDKIQRLTQLYAALTHCNQAIVRCCSKEELFAEVCRVAVDHGGMKMAWIGMLDDAGKRVVPVASYGEETSLLDGLYVTIDADAPHGRGPSGTAIRENQAFWCQDLKSDPRMEAWRDLVIRLNLGATAAVPLCMHGKPIGALSLYSAHTNAFDQESMDLLLRIGLDLSYAMENYEREAERRRNEEILRGESLETLSQRDHALREITQGVVITDASRRATYINDAFVRQTGYLPDEILGRSCRLLQGPNTSVETLAYMKSRLDSGLQYQGEILNYRKDGSTFWNDMSITPVLDGGGKLMQWVGVQRDVTEKIEAASRILRLSHLYAALSHCNHAIVHSDNPEDLFRQVCRSAVEFGGMRMAWVGKINEDGQQILPVASYGNGLEYLENVKILLDVDDPYGGSLTGMAVRTGEAFWCQDFMNTPALLPWRDLGEKYGVRSMAALPLRSNGMVVGSFTLYGGYAEAFDEEVQKLLLEMAQDVSFALDNFKREAERKRLEAQMRLASKVFAESAEGIAIADANYDIVMINKRYTEISGFTEDDVLGQNASGFINDWRDIGGFQALIDVMNTVGYWEGEIWTNRKDGASYLERFSVRRVVDEEDKQVHYVAMFADITEHRKSEERMHWLSHFDTLTGLTNRTLLEDRCRQAIKLSQSKNEPMALMFLDLDHFKNINDTIGHRIGDLLLVELANRLTFIAREQDTVSRLGGDDFVLALPGIDASDAAHIAGKVLETVAHPYHIEGHELIISGSIGIAMYPVDGIDFDTLIQSADMAMFRAKEIGRNNFCFFTAEIQARSMRALQLENALRRALEREQLLLHYQPQVSLDTGRIVGAEALLRWNHPEFGMVSPMEFIPIAESSGLILPIGEWVMRTATRQLKEWMNCGFDPMTMSVNLSAVQFRHPSLPDLVMQVLDECELPPEYFELELTESVAMENPQAAIAVLDELHRRGIRISIDDFGTGYSSLAHLKRFKVYKLKIDRSFVNDIANDLDDKAIVSAVISLADNLGLMTIAEGVETEEQLNYLRDNGCREIQGYYFSRPLPAEQFEAFLRSKRESQ